LEVTKDNIKVLYTEDTIKKRIKAMGEEITKNYQGLSAPLHMVCVLKGSVHFYSDLLFNIDMDINYSFIQVASYKGTESSGRINVKSWIDEPVQGKNVIVVEDILDTGRTLKYILNYLSRYRPATLEVATLIDKYEKDHFGIVPKYVGFETQDRFLLGYGLDYDQKFRNLPYIGYVE
jgi:hypoxanthine phosphoribosyltransferase